MSAVISECGKYRYVLKRNISQALRWNKPCLFIMLNPSTADAELDDPTIRRCIGFAKSWGCTELTVVNLFAYRATDPKELESVEDPKGPENLPYIVNELMNHKLGIVVAAWGSNKFAKIQAEYIERELGPFKSLGRNKDGSPKHPLYLPKNSELK